MLDKKTNGKRSPLKDRPLRNAGQSLDDEINRVYDENVIPYAFYIAFCIGLAAFEWISWLASVPPQPILVTIVGLLVTVYSVLRLRVVRAKMDQLKLARDGERIVGEMLAELREKGYIIFHDLVGDGFNLDHAVLSPNGIFAVETKTYKKRPDSKVVFDGKNVTIDGRQPDRNPVDQAAALSRWLHDMLKDSTGKDYPVRPVVVYPGWWVDSIKDAKTSNTWVLNPKALQSFIVNEPAKINPEDMKLAAYHLSRFIRAG